MKITDLEPKAIWQRFDEITKVPRPSKHEEQMVAFIENFAKQHSLPYKKDKCGNIVITKAATAGCENRKPIVLQSHMDMVCEKNASKQHNFLTDPIETIVDGEWLRANGTTLGADDGIGVAAELAILTDDSFAHGPIECLFTVDEETGLTGAENIQEGFFSGTALLNLDSEDEGEVFVGCAGGCTTKVNFQVETEPMPDNMLGLRIVATGLIGGHSGGDIHLERGNANKIMADFVAQAAEKCGLRIASFDGGNLHNAIAREAVVVGVVPFAERENIRVLLNNYTADVQEQLSVADPNFTMQMETTDEVSVLFTHSLQQRLISALRACPHGVIAMSKDIPDLVETSTNLASVKTTADGIFIGTSQRSSVESAKVAVQQRVAKAFADEGAAVECCEGYPGWTPNMQSPLLHLAKESYKHLFNKDVKVKAIHAGLECGLFLEKYPNLDMISFGPTLRGVHSPDEKVEIKTVQMFWDYLIDIVSNYDA
mgnify:CR=1 FL=1